jgi:hypothetical protein
MVYIYQHIIYERNEPGLPKNVLRMTRKQLNKIKRFITGGHICPDDLLPKELLKNHGIDVGTVEQALIWAQKEMSK